MPDIELTNLYQTHSHSSKNFHDLERSSTIPANPYPGNDTIYSPVYPPPKPLRRRLVTALVCEIITSLLIYINYDKINELSSSSLVAPTLLGSSTAALAQSTNQYVKKKYSLNRIFKFMMWGCINGCFTVLWIDVLIFQLDSLVLRILVDQLIGAPSFQLIFNVLNCLWDNGELNSSIKTTYLKSLKYSYCYWPFFSICSFMFIPQSMIFPANCLANLAWNLILSKLS